VERLETVPAPYKISNLAVFLDRHQPMVLQKAGILASRQKLPQQGGRKRKRKFKRGNTVARMAGFTTKMKMFQKMCSLSCY
jgi:hypothetical protein